MSAKKGFTLVEIIVVTVIIGILAVVAIPTYFNFMQQGSAKAAQNNLITIYNAQKNYYLSPTTGGTYCINTSPTPCDNLPDINAALSLNIADNNFNYTCITAGATSYSCTATNNSDNTLVLMVTSGTTPDTPNPIVLPGGATCASSTGANPGCNPSCADTAANNCPS